MLSAEDDGKLNAVPARKAYKWTYSDRQYKQEESVDKGHHEAKRDNWKLSSFEFSKRFLFVVIAAIQSKLQSFARWRKYQVTY